MADSFPEDPQGRSDAEIKPAAGAKDLPAPFKLKVLNVARQVAATLGTETFRAIATHLAAAIEADCVWIGGFVPGPVQRVRTLAIFPDGESGSLTFDLAGSACAHVAAAGKPYMCRKDAQKQFPDDQILRKVGAQSCVGIPLTDSTCSPAGAMMAIYRTPVATLRTALAVLEVFAPLASSGLQHKLEAERLRQSEQRYRAFIAQNANRLWRVEFEQPISTELPEEEQIELVHRHGYFAEANDAMARAQGMENSQQLIGRRIADIFPTISPFMRESLRDLIRSHYRCTSREGSEILPDGRRHYVVRNLMGIVEDGFVQRIWGIGYDITQFKHAQRELEASKQRMVDLLESLQVSVILSDPSGAILFCNDHFSALTGWQADDIRGKNWIELTIAAEDRARVQAEFTAAAGASAPVHFESTLVDVDGHHRHIEWDSTGLRDAEGKVGAIANVGRDCTQEKALRAQLQQAQKLESIGRLAGGVAHDFNNLLTVICGYSDLLLNELRPEDPAYAGLTEIQHAAYKGAELTHHLLAFSRRRPVRRELLNLNTVLEGDARMLRHLLGDNVELVTNLEPSLAPVSADAGEISQVLLNLASNARDAMPHGGRLTVASSHVVLGDQHASGFPGVPAGEYVQLAVTDTGIGMTEEVQARLFDPFFTTKEPGQGTGLGLSTVYGIIRQIGGHIVVESATGQGSTFRIFLPKAQPRPEPPEEPGTPPAMPRGTETVLLVDDRADVRGLTARMLRDLGYTVLEADGPSQALELAHEKVDLVLTDEIMPQMRGTALAERIKASNPRVGILIMSGYSDGTQQERHFDPGFPFLQKPFSQRELALAMRQALAPPLE